MTPEERGKLAVTMLVTGMYMAEGNSTGGFNMNNALNSFLQSEISNIAGKALDISLGMETVDNAEDGGKRTDYNFQFAKRFWNNRFRIVIGGKCLPVIQPSKMKHLLIMFPSNIVWTIAAPDMSKYSMTKTTKACSKVKSSKQESVSFCERK